MIISSHQFRNIVIAILFFTLTFPFQKTNAQGITAGFDTTSYHPVFIKSKDNQFLLNLGVYTQFRYNFNQRNGVPEGVDFNSYGYNLARTRIFMEGNFTSKFYYHLRANINSSNNFELFVAYLQYNLNSKMWIRGGRQFMALGLEDWMYPQDLASIEFSAQNFTYAIWSNFGFQFHHRPSNYFRYWLGIGNGAYGGRRSFPTPSATDFTVTGRAEYNILGNSWNQWGDMMGRKGNDLGMLLGVGLGQTFRRANKQEGLNGSNGGSQFNLDYSISGNGFHIFTHFTLTILRYDDDPEQNRPSFYGTAGYWLNKKLFSYVRFDYVGKGNAPESIATKDYASPGIGLAFYPFQWTNRYKFSVEYNHLDAKIDHTIVEPDGQLGWISSDYGSQQSIRFQIQFGF